MSWEITLFAAAVSFNNIYFILFYFILFYFILCIYLCINHNTGKWQHIVLEATAVEKESISMLLLLSCDPNHGYNSANDLHNIVQTVG